MGRPSDLLEPNNLRLVFAAASMAGDLGRALRADLGIARRAAGALLPPRNRTPPPLPTGDVFPARRPLALPGLSGARIAVVASGGSGATAALVGVQRAFEEAGIEPAALSCCSGSVLFGSLWAAGLSSDEVARLWLSLRPCDYLDVSPGRAVRAALRGLSRFGGIMRGDAIEDTYERALGGLRIGDTRVPLWAVVWNLDRNRMEYLSTEETPSIRLARAARVAISIPLMVEPVKLGRHYYGDGGVVDVFPARPVIEAWPPYDVVIGINSYLPEGFDGEDIEGWYQRSFSILRASGQLRYSAYLELARDHVRALGPKLTLLHPVSYEEVHGPRFFDSFLDRRDWPDYMRRGHDSARRALAHVSELRTIAAAEGPSAGRGDRIH